MAANFRFIYWAKDHKETTGFYRDMLECPVIHEWDRGPGKRGSVFELGSGEIEVLELQSGKKIIQAKGFEISINVPAVDEYYSYLKDKSIVIRGEIADKPWGARTFSVSDPNGIKLIFSSPL